MKLDNKEDIDINKLECTIDLFFDSKKYTMPNLKKKYRVGEILAEHSRLINHFEDVFDSIIKCSLYNEPISGLVLYHSLEEIEEILSSLIGIATSRLIKMYLLYGIKEYNKIVEEDSSFNFKKQYEILDNVHESFFNKEDCFEEEVNCVGQLLLASLAIVGASIINNVSLSSTILGILKEYDNNSLINSPISKLLFNNTFSIDYFKISYLVKLEDGKIRNLYKIHNVNSLLLFEFVNCINNEVKIKECKNCEKLFPIYGRADKTYCSYRAPGFENKTCKDVGANLTRINKVKTDFATSEYRRIYMQLKMRVRRHPNDLKSTNLLERLVDEGKKKRSELADKSLTEEEFLDWLKTFERRN